MNEPMRERFLRKEAQVSLSEVMELLHHEREEHAMTMNRLATTRKQLIWSWGLFAFALACIYYL